MSMIGTRVKRIEDPALLTVGGTYVDDVAQDGALIATFVRSVMAHARVAGVDTAEAAAMPGVVGVYTAADLGFELRPPAMPMFNQAMTRSKLTADVVRYVGEPVAVVVSETREQGVDAAEMVLIDYEPLDVVVDMVDAADGDLLLFPDAGTNVAFEITPDSDPVGPFGPPPGAGGDGGPTVDEVLADCEVVTSLTFRNQRLAPCPLEPRAVLSVWDGDNLTQYSATQGVHGTQMALAGNLGVPKENVRVITPDVGGAFGAKNGGYPEDITVAALARKLDRPVRWAETRSESMVGLVHGRAQVFNATIGGNRQGEIQAYKLDVIQDCGAYPEIGAILPALTQLMACGVYDIDAVEFRSRSVVTNTMPVGAYRGAGRPEAAHAIERMVDVFAAEIGMDPAEVRRRNVQRPEAFPLMTATGAEMDSGEYTKALDAALIEAGYDELRAEQQRRRQAGDPKLLGIGMATYVEVTNPTRSSEWGSIEVRPDGSALLLTGQSPHGQGHYTSFAQLASELTGIPVEKMEVRHGDTDLIPRGAGTGGSKALQIGGSAIWNATEAMVDKARSLAADLLEANPDDIVLDTDQGRFSVAGTPAIAVAWAQVATRAVEEGTDGSDGLEARLQAEVDFAPEGPTFPFGAHVSVVEVDRDTGEVTLVRHVACDDAGRIINPMLVDGQVHGGLAQGIAQAVVEEFSYDESGNPVTANFMDYGVISAAELPSFDRLEMETPTPLNPLGAKGIGESGTIGATPAVQNAVVDALSHLGINHIEIPVLPQRVWEALNVAGGTTPTGA